MLAIARSFDSRARYILARSYRTQATGVRGTGFEYKIR